MIYELNFAPQDWQNFLRNISFHIDHNMINRVEKKAEISTMHQSTVSVRSWAELWNLVFAISNKCLFGHKKNFLLSILSGEVQAILIKIDSYLFTHPHVSQQFKSNSPLVGNILFPYWLGGSVLPLLVHVNIIISTQCLLSMYCKRVAGFYG